MTVDVAEAQTLSGFEERLRKAVSHPAFAGGQRYAIPVEELWPDGDYPVIPECGYLRISGVPSCLACELWIFREAPGVVGVLSLFDLRPDINTMRALAACRVGIPINVSGYAFKLVKVL